MKRGIAVLVAALFVGGCGGSDSGGGSSADFVAAANKICKEDNAKFKALPPPTSSDPRQYLAKLLPLLDQDLARLRDLSPPSDDVATYEAWVSDLGRANALVERARVATSGSAATNILRGGAAIQKRADAQARRLGLKLCVSNAGKG